MSDSQSEPRLPASATNPLTGAAGFAGMAVALGWLGLGNPGVDGPLQAVLVCVAATVPMLACEMLWFRAWQPVATLRRRRCARRVAIKLLGLYAAYALISLAYWLFPEYPTDFYVPFFSVAIPLLPWLLMLAIPYFLWLDARTSEARGGCWHAGMAVLGRWSAVDREILGQYARGWLIKGFFLPLMFVYAVGSTDTVVDGLASAALFDANRRYDLLFHLAFLVDLVFVCIGYALTLRLFNSHIRSAEPTMLGWAVTLVCYQPFWSLISAQYLGYDSDGAGWGVWLANADLFATLWSSTILVLLAVYAWATVAFGIRFSNLTHRGIITSGPYRYSKHPAYVAKNLSWWMISVPFLTTGPWFEAVRDCVLLLMLNGIYYLRARTEERHLAQDPAYVQYALWMAEHGLLRRLGQWFPWAFAFRWQDCEQVRRALGLRRTRTGW